MSTLTHEQQMERADEAIKASENVIALSQAESKIRSLEKTIKEMKRVMIDNAVVCAECEQELTLSEEFEYGICVDCARMLS